MITYGAPLNTLFGLPVIQSFAAIGPSRRARRYPKRKARTAAHWRRMDKKWLKRYGYTPGEPQMYKLRSPLDGRETLIVHPALMPKLIAAVKEMRA